MAWIQSTYLNHIDLPKIIIVAINEDKLYASDFLIYSNDKSVPKTCSKEIPTCVEL